MRQYSSEGSPQFHVLGSLSSLVSRHIKDSQPFVCSKDCSTGSFPVASSVLIVSLNPCTDYYSAQELRGPSVDIGALSLQLPSLQGSAPRSLAVLHLCTLNSVSTSGDHLTLQLPKNSPEGKLEHSSHSSGWISPSLPPPPAFYKDRHPALPGFQCLNISFTDFWPVVELFEEEGGKCGPCYSMMTWSGSLVLQFETLKFN